MLALIGYARLYGVPIPTGVRLSVSYRDLAMEAGIGSLDTLSKSIHHRLKPAGWLRPDNGDRRARDAGAFVFLSERPQLIHTTSSRVANLPGMCVSVRDIPRLRHGGVGKKSAHLLDTLLMLGGSATVKDLATAMHEPRPAATGLCATTCRHRRDCGLRRYNRHDNAFRWLAAEP